MAVLCKVQVKLKVSYQTQSILSENYFGKVKEHYLNKTLTVFHIYCG